MQKKIYVIGHRNPDTDSVASAIAYAELKRLTGVSGVVPAMAGSPNPQTSYILERLGIDAPLYLADVHPKVRDVVKRAPITVTTRTPVRDALELFHRNNIRVLPVVDDLGRPVGIVSLLKLSERYLLSGRDRRGMETTLSSLADALQATFLAGSADDRLQHLDLFIGAMLEESFSARIEGYSSDTLMIITGDRPSIQQAAIERGVRLLVVSGGYTVSGELLARARDNGVTIMSTPYDTAAAAWMARLSPPVGELADTKFEKIGLGEPLSHLRAKIVHGSDAAVLAVDEDGALAGVATKSSLLAPIPYKVILVDHNEPAQAVPGVEAVEILEVIDHHKLGNPHTNQPIMFISSPVGSTCTIVAGLYRQHGIDPSPAVAGLLLAGILSDTVILKSPTTTEADREAVLLLEQLAGLDHSTFGKEIFSATGGLSAFGSPAKIVDTDFKVFTAGDRGFGVGQVEVIGFDEFFPMKDALLEVLIETRRREKLALAALMVTDIYSETTLFLVDGMRELPLVMDYPQVEPHLYELKGVMSRKKQMVPHLLKVLARI